jgi:hypothetical protein
LFRAEFGYCSHFSALNFVTETILVQAGHAEYSASYGKILTQWRYGATVSTRPFQGRNTGSIPVSATNLLLSDFPGFSKPPPANGRLNSQVVLLSFKEKVSEVCSMANFLGSFECSANCVGADSRFSAW